MITVNPVDVMCNCYGSHVIRSLLCLCKGVPLDSPEFHTTKSSTILAGRLNFRPLQSDGNSVPHQQGLPELLKFFVAEISKCAQKDIATMQVEQYSSLVLQASFQSLIYLLICILEFTHFKMHCINRKIKEPFLVLSAH